MKYFLISDNVDTLAGMRLVGVNGVVSLWRSGISTMSGRVRPSL